MNNINTLRSEIAATKASIMNEYKLSGYQLPSFEDRCKVNSKLNNLMKSFENILKRTPKHER